MEPASRILVSVPSNAAADLIAEHLVATNRFKPGDFVRLNGFLRSINKESQIILAGDPEQLGPVLMCGVKFNNVLECSFLERLMGNKSKKSERR
ncbi:unnamed protein product [Allacma fusca]|uniref:RNA helicase n=1 Tax=Allacma fusca TaxID=39272 RepID=A0A8J2P890_9HEXA|nr:unnamed protein product [Allacma fusca]